MTGLKGSKIIQAIVDTGATNSVIDENLAEELGVTPTRADEVVLAHGSIEKIGVGSAEFEIQGIKQTVPVYIYRGNLIGLTTLEAAGLRVNPVAQTLEKTPGKLLHLTQLSKSCLPSLVGRHATT